MNAFGDIKKVMELRKQAKEIQKKLKKIHVEAEEGDVVITISAEQEVMAVEIKNESLDPKSKKNLETSLTKAFNKGIKKSQEIAAENMKGLLGELGGGLDQ